MNIDKDGLASLLERVREAKGPDRNLDAMIHHWALDGVGTGAYSNSPAYTASIDASLALVERVAGGEGEQPLVYNFELGWHASAHDHMAYTADLFVADGDPAVMLSYHAQAHTLPLAILAALLTALKEVR